MKAAIRETRNRLAAQVAQTADHVSVKAERPWAEWAMVQSRRIAAAGRARRVWTDARRTGLLHRAAMGGRILPSRLPPEPNDDELGIGPDDD